MRTHPILVACVLCAIRADAQPKPACETIAAWIDDSPIPCTEVLSLPGAGLSDSAFCYQIGEAILRRAEARKLLDEGRSPAESELAKEIERRVPSREELFERRRVSRAKHRAITRALRESRAEPLRDLEIWTAQLSDYMSYSTWVSFRQTYAGSPMEPTSDDGGSLDLERQVLVKELRAQTLRYRFQIVLREAAKSDSARATLPPWSEALSDRFFVEFLSRHQVRIAPGLGCAAVEASLFRRPTAE